MTDQEKTPTQRQKEALRCIFEGISVRDRRYATNNMGRGYASSMGGATARMIQSMGEAGWLEEYSSRMGHTYYRHKLTAAGLLALALAWPDLPGVEEAIIAAREAESQARIEAAQEAQRAARQRAIDAANRREKRASALREMMQGYQISLDSLTGDQCADIWEAIVSKELDL